MDAGFCFLFGNRQAPDCCRPAVMEALEKCYVEHGLRCFIVGMHGNFDQIAISALREFKKRHGDVSLLMLTPYHPFDCPTEAPGGFDGTYYPPGQEDALPKFAIVKANAYCVKNCAAAICYAKQPGNSRELLARLQRRTNIPCFNVALILMVDSESIT